MTPEATLEDGTELFVYPSKGCASCYFNRGRCERPAKLSNTLACLKLFRPDRRDVIFLTKEQYLLRCMTEGAP